MAGEKSLASGEPHDAAQDDNNDPTQQQQQQSEEGDWRSALPEELKSATTLTKFTGKDAGEVVAKLAKSYVELEKMKFPSPDASPEELARFYDKLGRPQKPEDYTIKPPEQLPPGVEWDAELEKGFRDKAHELGLTNAQATKLMEWYQGDYLASMGESFWTPEKGLAALEQVWKTDDQVKRNLSAVNRVVKEYGDKDFAELLDTTGMGNHPAIIQFLAKVGAKLTAEDTAPPRHQSGGGMTPDEARAEIARIRNDRAHPYHKGDVESIAYMDKLYQAIHGNKVRLEVG